MEKRLPFYQQLKHERERRGWSQADVASVIGVDVKTVNRWESGNRKPLPYYRQLLCKTFDKNAEEFGLLEDINQPPEISSASHTINVQRSSQPPPIPPEQRGEIIDASGLVHPIPVRVDWGEAPSIESFYGRDRELDELKQWIVEDHCRIVAVLGMGGVGKTTLSTVLAEQIKDAFEYVFWRSLQNAPPLEHILKQYLQFVSEQQYADFSLSINDQILLLIQYLRKHRCFLILDNVESLLQAGQRVGQYQEGYESYGTFFQRLGEAQHRSCLLLTSREKPREVVRLEGKTLPVRSLQLPGVGYAEGQELLKSKDLFGTKEQWEALINLYSGNPLALKLVSASIKGIFGGSIGRFLEEEEIAFGDINELLAQHFHRLTTQEQEILYWLAIEREAVSLEDLRENFVPPMSKGELLEALDSLQRRSLIETRNVAQFALQPVIMEYMTNKIIKQAFEEFGKGTASVWRNYSFMKAQAKDHVRDSQVRLILDPVAEQLLSTYGKDGIEQKLRDMLSTERQASPLQHSYMAGNILNLLVHLHYDLRDTDFSSLMIWQAYLQNVTLPGVNFAHAHFAATTFTNTFGNILSVTFGRRGKLLAAGTATGEIYLYQVLNGTPLLTLQGHTDAVWSVTFNSDENILISSSDDQTIRLWDVSTGRCLKTLQGHTNRVRTVALRPDDTVLVSGSDDQTIRLWDMNTGHCNRTLHGHTDRVWSIAFSPDGTILASGSTDRTICLWNVHTGHHLKTLQGHTGAIRSIAFSPNSSTLASGSDDQTIRLWNVNTGSCIKILSGHTNRVLSVAFSPDGNILASGSEDQTARLWNAHSGHCLKILQNHIHGIRSVAFSPDGQLLASGGEDQTVRLWDVRTGYCLKTLQGFTNRIWSIAFGPDGQMLVSGSEDQTIRLWNVSTGQCLYTLQDYAHGVRSVAFSPDGHYIASGGEDQTIRLWSVNTGRCLNIFKGHTYWVWSVAFSPDGQTLASGGEDQTVRLWDMSMGRCLSTLRGHTNWVRSVAFSPDGKTLASCSDDQTIKLWETSTGRCLRTLESHTNRVRSVVFSPDGKTLASASEDQTIRVWEASTGRCLSTLHGHTNWVRFVAFSPDGKTLASGSEDQTICLWEVSTSRCLSILHGHTNRIRSVVFSPDGKTLASGSDDGTIKLWDIQAAECLKTLISERPYERMNITKVSGLTEAQKATLKVLGAIEDEG